MNLDKKFKILCQIFSGLKPSAVEINDITACTLLCKKCSSGQLGLPSLVSLFQSRELMRAYLSRGSFARKYIAQFLDVLRVLRIIQSCFTQDDKS